MTDNKQTREIDLFDLFASMGRGIKNMMFWFYDTFMWCFFFGIKKYKILLVFFAIGLTLGLFNIFKGRQQYTSGMLIRSNAISSFELKGILDEFNNYFKNSEPASDKLIMQFLDMDSAQLSEISGIDVHYAIDVNNDESIDYYDLKDDANPKDTIVVRDKYHLYVVAHIYNPLILPKLQAGLVNYIQTQPVVIEANALRLNKMNERIRYYTTESMYLDSLQKNTYFEKSVPEIKYSSNQLMLGESKKQLVHNEKLNILYAKQETEKEVTINKNATTVINDFPIAAEKVNTPVSSVIKEIILFMFIGYVIALLWYFLSRVSGDYMKRIED